MPEQHVDVLIVGAGISGIGMACHLNRECPGKTYTILERRSSIGGTWDLFRYPGIRSDSDMFTFGYGFRPWQDTRILADGTAIREYVQATAAENDVTDNIRFGVKVVSASFSTATARWTVEALDEATGQAMTFTADFFMPCTGYYDYDNGYRPDFPNEDAFQGQIVHPQHWPEDLDYAGKKVVIIGSGATAVTLVPAMAETAGHVTMLQRSPTYVLSLPAVDKLTEAMRKVLPDRVVYTLTRARNIGTQRAIYALAKARPNLVKGIIRKGAERGLQGAADMKHFTPKYDPWDQRLCIVPDGDLFRVIREGKAEVVTDTIASFTPTGIELTSGQTLEADIIITATGLNVQLLGGAKLDVDGEPVVVNRGATYKGVLLDGVPNAAIVFGYINASWTLRADLAAEYVCRLINHMDEHGYSQVVAQTTDSDLEEGSMLDALSSGYVKRGADRLPRQGASGPWRLQHNYLKDVPMLRRGSIDDGILRFSRERVEPAVSTARPRPKATA